ncbi:MAG: type II secretion system protein [Huintestinicola sp.]
MSSKASKGSRRVLKAFTLLELVIVIAIIGILAGIAVPNFITFRRTAKIDAANANAQEVFNAAQNYLVSLEVNGRDASKYFGKDGSTKLGYIFVDYGLGKQRSSVPADEEGDTVKTSDILACATGAVPANVKDACDGITANLSSEVEGSWLVAVYPDTYTVKYVVFSNEPCKSSGSGCMYNVDAVEAVGMPDTGTLYTGKYGYATAGTQEYELKTNPDNAFTGQYPIP